MSNIYLIIFVLYLLYYAGNLIYDGFVKEKKTIGKENLTEYTVGDVPEQIEESVSIVQIDDVENLNTPHSFQKRETMSNTDLEDENNDQNLEKLRLAFETEQELEHLEEINHNQSVVKEKEDEETSSSGNENRKPKKFEMQKMLNEAETRIQLVGRKEGYPIYNLV